MKSFKKIISVILIAICCCFSALISGCDSTTERESIVIAAPDGAPLLAIYNVLASQEKIGGYKVEVKVMAGASNIATVVTSGQADVAVMPTNIASKLYNNGVDIKLLSVNVFGVLYMIGNEPISSLNDLKGKIVCNIGRGGSPDLTLKLILDENSVSYTESEKAVQDKVALNYVGDGSEAIAMLKNGKCDYAVVGEPVVTQAQKVLGAKVVLNLQQEWASCVGEDSYMQAGVVLSDSVYNKSYFVRELIDLLEKNQEYLANDYSNAKSVLQNNGSALKVDFTPQTVDRLNIGFMHAKDARARLEKYYQAILSYDKTFIGGKLPDENFYYNYEK